MSFLQRVLYGAAGSATPPPYDDFWYTEYMGGAVAGNIRISPEAAKTLGHIAATLADSEGLQAHAQSARYRT